jgi:hypothetical protein
MQTEDTDHVRLDPVLNSIRDVLVHWGCPDPEIKLVPPIVFAEVVKIIRTKCVSKLELDKISVYADGVHALLKHDKSTNPHLAAQGRVSDALVALLTRCISIASSSLCVNQSVTKQYVSPFTTPFEEMVKTGSYFPNHPVIRTFPWFLYDFNNSMAKTKRQEALFMKLKDQAEIELKEELDQMGHTCNKYKSSQRALTPGIFTVFCGGCGVCEGFEIMPVAESPLTAFHVFANRSWNSHDETTLKNSRGQTTFNTGAWVDCLGPVPSLGL